MTFLDKITNKMNAYKHGVSNIVRNEYNEVMDVWEKSVRATHSFLQEDDISLYKKLIPEKYLDVVRLYAVRDNLNKIIGFMGVSNNHIEMLFIRPEMRGKGVGKTLVNYAINELKLQKVDVNEQNEQAVGFYIRMGFTVKGRSEFDSIGKPYPILHLEFKPEKCSLR
jgi:putative acetyltransferase